jgi:hypothetical protein
VPQIIFVAAIALPNLLKLVAGTAAIFCRDDGRASRALEVLKTVCPSGH